jgi:hypothetical protein
VPERQPIPPALDLAGWGAGSRGTCRRRSDRVVSRGRSSGRPLPACPYSFNCQRGSGTSGCALAYLSPEALAEKRRAFEEQIAAMRAAGVELGGATTFLPDQDGYRFATR